MRTFFFLSLLLILGICGRVAGQSRLEGGGYAVTTKGAWCWFADPRALHYANADGTINKTYVGYIDTHGNIRAMQYDFLHKRQDEVLIRSWFQPDDHNNPTFLVLPDERVMVFYSRHTDEARFYYRVSRLPGDITTLGRECVIHTQHNTTYPSPFILAGDPHHIYLCWRGIGWHPTIAKLTLPDGEDHVRMVWGPHRLVHSTAARPYAKYMSDGKERIYFAYTTGHPDNELPNHLYFNYINIRTGTLENVRGEVLDSIGGAPLPVDKRADYATRYPYTVASASPERDWVWQVAADGQGRPVIAMTRISADKSTHRYYYIRWDGQQWQQTWLADAGSAFHQTPGLEMCYSGGMAIDPENVAQVYCSVPVAGKHGTVYEIIKYTLGAAGNVVSTEAVTHDSRQNNVRPYVIPGRDRTPLRLTWMYGNYYDWIVSERHPQGYCTGIASDFAGFSTPFAGKRLEAGKPRRFDPRKAFTFEQEICLDTAYYHGSLLRMGELEYRLNAETLKPEVHYRGKTYASTNVLGTADNWQTAPRGTGGVWYAPRKYERIRLRMEYADGDLRIYINGLLDQRIDLSGRPPFVLRRPDYSRSPYTGMTRRHWIEAGEYLLRGAFGYIHTLDDPMYFPKQLEKTYPQRASQVPVAKLEGLARTLFIAAPLLRENPMLRLNGISVAEYYRHQLVSLSNPRSAHYISHRTGGPSQTLLELGSLAISMQAAREVLWDPLSPAQRDSLAATMLSYGEGPSIGSNWMFFNVFILSFLKDKGYAVNETYLETNLRRLLERYRGEGWYNDAPAYDYYSAWAYQTYGPLWAEMFGHRQYPELARQFMAHQHDLIDNYPYLFSSEGRMNMWGRSICYRFASTAPLSLLEYDRSGAVNPGWMRRISSATLLQFLEHPEFLEGGIPTMGFYGPFAPAVQIYSCRGSVYWCGKAFLNLLLPEDADYWTATENNGPWEKELKKNRVYNKFQPATNLLITNYPNCGGSEVRSWCHETVAGDWQKFRSTENYNKLAYHTEFPWMADGTAGEVSMNYAVKNSKGAWEVLRLYTFRSFAEGIYRRDAVLETDSTVRFSLADIPLPDGVLRIDKVSVGAPTELRLGHYSLPEVDGMPLQETHRKVSGQEVSLLSNGTYRLATIPLAGWTQTETLYPEGLHPVSHRCGLPMVADTLSGSRIYITLLLWKRIDGKAEFTQRELRLVRSVEIAEDASSVSVRLATGEVRKVYFDW